MSENTNTPAPHRVTVEVGGRPLILETGKIAKQANGAIVARYGDTVVLTTACIAPIANDRDFLPLTVDYRENTYSAGKIPGGFFKREGRPSEKEVLTSRLIDRRLRPRRIARWPAGDQPHRRRPEEKFDEYHHRRHGRSHRHGGIRRARSLRRSCRGCSRVRSHADQENRRRHQGTSRAAQAQESRRSAPPFRRKHLQGPPEKIR